MESSENYVKMAGNRSSRRDEKKKEEMAERPGLVWSSLFSPAHKMTCMLTAQCSRWQNPQTENKWSIDDRENTLRPEAALSDIK